MLKHPTRRDLLQSAVVGAVAATATEASAAGEAEHSSWADRATVTFESLGVKHIINCKGTVTVLGGSTMPPEVVASMAEATRHFVDLFDLQRKAGDRIASMIGVPAVMISCGAASAITCGTAACLHRGDAEQANRLPDVTGIPHNVILQRAHHAYGTQLWLTGARPVWADTRAELEQAIRQEKPAMMFFLNRADSEGQIRRGEWIEVAKKHDIPTLNDAAADVPPASRLKTYVNEGFDLVIFSGGKGLLGPQSTGLLLGRADLVDAAWMSISPRGGIGRGMKVGKEEIIGLVAAVERYLRIDHDAERRELDTRAAYLTKTLNALPGVQARINVPPVANRVPHVTVQWDQQARGKTAGQVIGELLTGDPPIAVLGGDDRLQLSVWTLQPGEDVIVANRLREILG